MKKLAIGICALAMAAGINASVYGEYAGQEREQREIVSEVKTDRNRSTKDNKGKPVILKEKWDALNDMQKEEIYKLKDVSIDIECKIIDKYIEFGIIDRGAGEQVKLKKAEYKAEMRKSGKIPGYHERPVRDKKFKQ